VTTRRGFLIALGAGVLAVPRGSLAQPQPKGGRIGFLYFGSRQSSLDTGRYNAFVQGMRELRYVEGRNFSIEACFADGKNERLPALAAELVRLKVDVIVAAGTPVIRALQHATTTIPVVSTVTSDPVGDGFAASMARPGGNITGLSIGAADLGPKQLELLKAAVPKLSRVAVLVQPENSALPPRLKRIMSAAQKVGIQVVLAEAGTVQEIEREFSMMMKERANAVIILTDSFFLQESRSIAAQALKHRLPSISANHEYAGAGGLMSYGANLVDNFRHAATYVDKILKGTKPGELPFEQPTRYSLIINRKTAMALGLTIPQALLGQADEVVQ
jgi:putative ABC transport system substrate-binding protein